MKLQTKLNLKAQADNQIDYHSSITAFGSCFVEHIGDKLQYFKFKNKINPFGIIFNPVSIERIILRSIKAEVYTDSDVFYFNDLWHCSEAHSKLSSSSNQELVDQLNRAQQEIQNHIKSSSHLIITLGTAWVYKDIREDVIVANCHKRPQQDFAKQLLSIKEIEHSIINIAEVVSDYNPECSIIFTVSPVRHLKDGMVENSISKAHLITALHTAIKDSKNSEYFPSYEIMMDELRDYRFYERDMLHPNQLAVDYIWERFKEVWISSEVEAALKKVERLQRAMKHKPVNPNSISYKKHLKKITELKEELISQYPEIIIN